MPPLRCHCAPAPFGSPTAPLALGAEEAAAGDFCRIDAGQVDRSEASLSFAESIESSANGGLDLPGFEANYALI